MLWTILRIMAARIRTAVLKYGLRDLTGLPLTSRVT